LQWSEKSNNWKNLPIILGEPVVEAFTHIQSLKCYNKLFLEFHVLIDVAHPLLSGASPKIMNIFEVSGGFLFRCLPQCLLLFESLFLKHVVVLAHHLRL
jgi:hypothetical protein